MGKERCYPGRVSYKDEDGRSVICIGNERPATPEYDYPSSRDHDGRGNSSWADEASERESSYGPSGYFSNTGQYCGTYTEKYAADISSALVAMHGSKPSLVLGFNPSILTHQKDTDGVSMQTKGLINDLNYQLTVSGFKDPKGIILAHCDQTDIDMGVLVQTLQPFAFNLTVIDFSNNRLGDTAVENLFYTMGTHQVPAKFVQCINLSNNFIGDYGAEYIAQSLVSGRYPATKHIDISGNNITLSGEKFIVNALQQEIVQDILVTLKKSYDIKTMISGNKEQKQFLIRETLQNAQDEGVDVRNVAVSKSITEKMLNLGLAIKDFSIGFGKCYIVPEDTQTFAGERILAKASKKAFGANNVKDAVVCFFDTVEEVATSNIGVQVIKDLDLLGANEVIDSIE